ncbi:nitroreductase family protein [Enterococcus bulliens]
MKEIIKNLIPNFLWEKLKSIYMTSELKKLAKHDQQVFLSGYTNFSNLKNANIEQLGSHLMFYSHSIEKGLSHSNFRAKFGQLNLKNLSEVLDVYNSKEFDKENIRYQIAIDALNKYIKIHNDLNIDISFIESIFSEEILCEIKQINTLVSKKAGIETVLKSNKKNNKDKNFKELALGRSSIREYSNESIEKEKILSAIDISLKSPSVCNRQPSRVYIVDDQEMIDSLLKIQGGYNGFPTPDKLLLITASNTSFINIEERNQSFIDGGLFAMSLLYSLEFEGIAACPLNAMMNIKKEKSIRDLINIPSNESLIMFISLGNFKDSVKVPISYRDNIKSVVK